MSYAIFEIPKSVEIQKHLTDIHIEDWIKQDVFHFTWWALIGLICIYIFIWWKILDKQRAPEICLYVVLATLLVLGIVEYGEELILWEYPIDIIPIFPPLTSINLISLPLVYSLTYQYFKTKKSFVVATIIITAILCFILEPILVWGNLYKLLHWKYYFSFPIYVSVAICVRLLVTKINSIAEKNKNTRF